MTNGMEAEETGPGVTSGETLIGSSSDGKTSTPGLQSRSRSSQGEARRKTLATSIRSHFSGANLIQRMHCYLISCFAWDELLPLFGFSRSPIEV